jgi:prepilin signal peptidase PulO-like enzyme (type II secretory pathway)
MSNEKFCYIHTDTPTRISCSACGKPICTKCVIPAAIGYHCPDCETPIEKTTEISALSWFHTIFQAILAGIVLGFLYNFVKPFGMFISWGSAYLVGFAIAKTITKNSGFQEQKRFIAIASVITILSVVYNPISLIFTSLQIGLVNAFVLFTMYYISNITVNSRC